MDVSVKRVSFTKREEIINEENKKINRNYAQSDNDIGHNGNIGKSNRSRRWCRNRCRDGT